MIEGKNGKVLIGSVLSVSLLTAAVTALLLINFGSNVCFQVMGQFCQEVIENQPEAEQAILMTLKNFAYHPKALSGESILERYGYRRTDFLFSVGKYGILAATAGFLAGGILFFAAFIFRNRGETARIEALTDYLEKVNSGSSGVLLQTGSDHFSGLQDEIYKTVTSLQQLQEAAISARNHFAENLYNIAHQIKTPITAISLTVQIMREDPSPKYAEQILRQLSRLTHLEEALLLLSRIDAGTLPLERKEVDVFTVLTLAADNLQELFSGAGVSVQIPESGQTTIRADLDWTMEALMNLLKNCAEHTPAGGMVCCSCEQNPLYVQICIWDTGEGFAKEDIPHLFERFYRGKNAENGGLGIGLALAREIIVRQNGTVNARNLPGGGACFEVRFYSH